MAAKGSRKNPYTLSEYNAPSNNWLGGWVKESEDVIIYHTAERVVTYTGCCAKSNPVPGNIYSEMAQIGVWLGGWVLFGASLKKYVDSNGNEYNSSLGSQSNPCTINLYSEMLSNGIWEGGWIQEDGQILYIQVYNLTLNSGSGCGSGSGSGSDSGCGSGSGYGSGSGCGSGNSGSSSSGGFRIRVGKCNRAGDVVIKDPTKPKEQQKKVGELNISWTEGNTQGQDSLSEVTVTIKIKDYTYCVLQNNSYTSWVAPYIVAIHGTFIIQHNHDQEEYSIDGRYTIPMEYYQI